MYVWVFVCEILCVPVRLCESGCEKTSACLSESVRPESSVVYKQESASVSFCVYVHMCLTLRDKQLKILN